MAGISLSDFTPAELASLVSQLDAAKAMSNEAEAKERARREEWLTAQIVDAVREFPQKKYSNGVGITVSARVEVPQEDGTVRAVRGMFRFRWEDTMPKKAKEEAEAEEKAEAEPNNSGGRA